jgi:hypothetical protein
MDSKFSSDDILLEIERQDRKRVASTGSDIDIIVKRATEESVEEEEVVVDIVEYIRAEWGLNENPYPIQRFILKVIFGIPLDDRHDDLITEVISPTQFKCFRPDQFRRVKYLDIGENRAVKVRKVNLLKKIVILDEEPEVPLLVGDAVTGRIEVWDKFRENIVGTYNETEFFDFLYGDGPGSETCRISLSREEYERNLGRQMNLVVFRLGRRGTKSSLAQWIAAYFCYRVLKKYHPQEYYQTRRDQPITITLIATTKIQAQDLLAPARATIKRSPYLRRFVDHDDVRRIDLNTPYNIDHGLDSESGIKVKADPCSARATRGPAIMLGLLEEFGLFMSHIKDSNSSDKEIYTAIAPGITDLKNPETDEPEGMMIIVSTPLTTESYMYEVESSIWDGDSELSNSLALHIPSPWVNPLLSSKSLRSFHAVDPTGYEQEYEAKYSDQYRKAFTRDVVERCRQDPGDHQWLHPGEDVFLGFDLGGLKLGSDRTTISIIAMNSEGLGRLIFHEVIGYGLSGYEDYLDETREELDLLCIKKIAKRIDELWVRWSVRKGLGDQWNAYGVTSHLTSEARDGLDLTNMTAAFNDMVARNFVAYIEQAQITIFASFEDWKIDDSLIRELCRLDRKETGGSVKKIALRCPETEGQYDDQYSSISRALFIAQQEIVKQPPNITSGRPGSSPLVSVRERAEMARQRQEVLMRTQRGHTLINKGGPFRR